MKRLPLFIAIVMACVLVSCADDLGKKLHAGRIDLYYKDITEKQAQNTLLLLSEMDSIQGNGSQAPRQFQLIKKNDTLCFRIATAKAKDNSADTTPFLTICNIISNAVFNAAPVNMELTDNNFETIRKIPYQKVDLDKLTDPADAR
jgi:hypothetical protein